jgi:hypothetical protein
LKSLIEYIEKLAPFIGAYPVWFQYCIAIWLMLTASAFVGLVFLSPAARKSEPPSTDVDSLSVQLRKVVQAKLAVAPATAERYADIVKSPEAGIVRLLADGSKFENAIRGGGTYYAFLRRDQEYNYGSDIQLQTSQFKTGFAGANYGYFLRLGKVPIRQLLDSANVAPPSWLDQSRHQAWQYMWNYQPPRDIKEIRTHQSEAKHLVKGGVPVSETTPAITEEAYLLRSVQIDRWDILVAFQVVERSDDGAVVLVWKIVRAFDTPVATGKE